MNVKYCGVKTEAVFDCSVGGEEVVVRVPFDDQEDAPDIAAIIDNLLNDTHTAEACRSLGDALSRFMSPDSADKPAQSSAVERVNAASALARALDRAWSLASLD